MKRSKAKLKQSNSAPLLMILAGTVLIVSILIWQVVTSAQSAASTATPVGEIPVDRISRVALEQAKTAFDTKAAVFVDVRSSGSFLNQHITGSVSIPLSELPNRLGELSKQDWIIPYCTWPNEETSARAAQIMLANGFTNVTPLLGGFEAWINQGYPVQP